jgi:hypothetical protein
MVKNLSSLLRIAAKKPVVGEIAKLVSDVGSFHAGEFVEVLAIKRKNKYEVESMITGTIEIVDGDVLRAAE